MPRASPARRLNARTSTQTRRRQSAGDPNQKQRRSHHGSGKWNILGVVEHGAVPGAAHRKRSCSDQAGTRPRDQSRRRRASCDPGDPRHRAQNMAQFEGMERNDLGDRHGDDVEQAAIEVEILKGEQVASCKSAPVIVDDQFAVMVLHTLVVGNRVVPEGEQRDNRQRREEREGQEIVRIGPGDAPSDSVRQPAALRDRGRRRRLRARVSTANDQGSDFISAIAQTGLRQRAGIASDAGSIASCTSA